MQNTELNSLPIFDDRYIKTKIRTLYSFMRKKYYLQVYLDNWASKFIDKQMIENLNDHLFYSD